MPDDVPAGGGLGGRCVGAAVSEANDQHWPDDVPLEGGLSVAGAPAERPFERQERETEQ